MWFIINVFFFFAFLCSTAASLGQRRALSLCNQTDDTRPAVCYASSHPQVFQRAQAVSRVWYRFEGTLLSHCTAWLVGCEGHVMTNQHCVASQEEANQLEFEFLAQGTDCANECKQGHLPCPGSIHIREPLRVIHTGTSSLDYTLLQLPPVFRNLSAQLGYLTLRSTGPQVGEPVYIPQHPLGYGKRIAMYDGNMNVSILATDVQDFNNCGDNVVTHNGDTISGTSGSPLLSRLDHTVVALHHCGGCDEFGQNGAIAATRIIQDAIQYLPTCAISS